MMARLRTLGLHRPLTNVKGLTEVVVDVGLLITSVAVANAGTAAVTKAVVANAVVLLPGDCVTAVVPVGREGVPVKVGEASGALVVSVPWTWSALA
jgi:hypothetical protein